MKMKFLSRAFDIVIPLLFYSLFLFVPLFFTNVTDELFEFNKMLAVYVIALLLGFCYVGRCIIEKRFIWKHTLLEIPILLFVISQIISTILSIDIRTSLFGYYSRFNGGLFSVFSYAWLYFAFIQLIHPKQIKALIISMLIGGTFSALYAFPEHFGHSPSCLLFTGHFNDSCWVQEVQIRIFGTFGQPNWLAAYLGMLIPIVITEFMSLFYNAKRSLKNILSMIGYAFIGLLFSMDIIYTASRSGIAGEVAALLFLCISTSVCVFMMRKVEIGSRLKTAVGITFLGFLIFSVLIVRSGELSSSKIVSDVLGSLHIALAPSPKTDITNSTTSAPASAGNQLEVGGSESGQIRAVVWKGAIAVWKRYPIFGSGVETFGYSYFKDRPKEHNLLSEWDFLYNKAHNELLNYLATTGIIGLSAYIILILAMMAVCLKTAYSTMKRKSKSGLSVILLCLGLVAGLIELHISNFFGFSTVMVSALMFIFPALAIKMNEYEMLNKDKKSEIFTYSQQNSAINADQVTIIAISAILFAIPIFYVTKIWNADKIYAAGKQAESSDLQTAFLDLKQATDMIPSEPTYHDELSVVSAQLALSFAQNKDSTSAAQIASFAIQESDKTFQENHVHLNFYKSRIRLFFTLAQLNPAFYSNAQETLLQAINLSPTDPKLVYNLALIQLVTGNKTEYRKLLIKAVELRPIDNEFRLALAKSYEETHEYQSALEQYQYMIQYTDRGNKDYLLHIASISAILQSKK